MAQREVFLFFQDGDNDAYCYPLSAFRGFRHSSDTTLVMHFNPANNTLETTAAGHDDIATLTIASGKQKEAIIDIVNLINSHPHTTGVLTIADTPNQVYCSTHITDVAGTIDT
tara:strand:+ start:1071 stop:1409 length:339 start_codon:yes stop_codon:yes gene_type:complete